MSTELPSINISDQETDPGWRRVGIGDIIKTHYQTYSFGPEVGWRISSFWSVEQFKNSGRSNHRRPVSLHAWSEVIPQLLRKWYNRIVRGQGGPLEKNGVMK